METYNENEMARLVGQITTLATLITLSTPHAAFAEFAGHTTDVMVRVYTDKQDRSVTMYRLNTYASEEWFKLTKGDTYRKLQATKTYLQQLLEDSKTIEAV